MEALRLHVKQRAGPLDVSARDRDSPHSAAHRDRKIAALKLRDFDAGRTVSRVMTG
jgi:hypothetical protein